MNENFSTAKKSKAIYVFNIVLLIFSIIIISGLIAINFSRESIVEISNQIYQPEKPLMDSYVLDLLLSKGMSIIIFFFAVWLIIKEIRIKLISKRLRANIVAFTCLAVYAFLIIYLLYAPVLNAN